MHEQGGTRKKRDQPISGADGEELEGPVLINVLRADRRKEESEPETEADQHGAPDAVRFGPSKHMEQHERNEQAPDKRDHQSTDHADFHLLGGQVDRGLPHIAEEDGRVPKHTEKPLQQGRSEHGQVIEMKYAH